MMFDYLIVLNLLFFTILSKEESCTSFTILSLDSIKLKTSMDCSFSEYNNSLKPLEWIQESKCADSSELHLSPPKRSTNSDHMSFNLHSWMANYPYNTKDDDDNKSQLENLYKEYLIKTKNNLILGSIILDADHIYVGVTRNNQIHLESIDCFGWKNIKIFSYYLLYKDSMTNQMKIEHPCLANSEHFKIDYFKREKCIDNKFLEPLHGVEFVGKYNDTKCNDLMAQTVQIIPHYKPLIKQLHKALSLNLAGNPISSLNPYLIITTTGQTQLPLTSFNVLHIPNKFAENIFINRIVVPLLQNEYSSTVLQDNKKQESAKKNNHMKEEEEDDTPYRRNVRTVKRAKNISILFVVMFVVLSILVLFALLISKPLPKIK